MSTISGQVAGTPSQPGKVPDTIDEAERKKAARRETAKFRVEVGGLVVLILTVVATAAGVWVTRQEIDRLDAQISESRFETTYQHYLDLWTLAAENPQLAPYIVGGDKPNERLDKGEGEKEAIRAAVFKSLDVTSYAFNRAPRMRDGSLPPRILDPSAPKPKGIDEGEWYDGRTWAATIISAFEDSPGMCPLLSGEQGRKLYGPEFQDAVRDAVPNCITD